MIPWAKPTLFGKEERYVQEALRSTWISGGPFVDRLEKDFCETLQVPFAAVVSNGTAALHLAYLALGVGHQDEVIVPGFAYQGAANIAILCGARPVFVEVDSATWCLDPSSLESAITPRTRAIVPIHTYGNVCDLTAILSVAGSRGTPVVEDVSESMMSEWEGRQAGTIGTIGTYSFHATKTITTGEGGMVVTRDPELDQRARLFRSHGMLRAGRYYWHEVPGHNFRLTNLQAAMGCAQLESIQEIVARRRAVHAMYRRELDGESGVTLQHFDARVMPVLWALALKLDPGAFPQGRDRVIDQMRELDVECRPGFYAASQQPIYDSLALPVCEDLARNVISLPTFPDLTEELVHTICQGLRKLKR